MNLVNTLLNITNFFLIYYKIFEDKQLKIKKHITIQKTTIQFNIQML